MCTLDYYLKERAYYYDIRCYTGSVMVIIKFRVVSMVSVVIFERCLTFVDLVCQYRVYGRHRTV